MSRKGKKKVSVMTFNTVVIVSILGMLAIMLLSNHSLENMINVKQTEKVESVATSNKEEMK